MLTGRRAFCGVNTIATLTAVLRDDIQPIAEAKPETPPELVRVVDMCLKKNPAERYQSMTDVQAALLPMKRMSDSGALDIPTMRGVTPLPPRAETTVTISKRPNTAAMGAAAAVILLALGGGAHWLMNRKAQPAPAVQQEATPVTPSAPMPPPQSAPNQSAAPAPEPVELKIVLGDSLPVRLVLDEDVPGDAVAGDPVKFKVGHDVLVDDTVVIRKGAPASGVIVDGAKRRVFGLGGKMTYRLQGVEAVDGQQVNLRATETASPNSKRPVNNGGTRTREITAFSGGEYVGYIDGSNTVTVKK
jgi:hypothetical protein